MNRNIKDTFNIFESLAEGKIAFQLRIKVCLNSELIVISQIIAGLVDHFLGL